MSAQPYLNRAHTSIVRVEQQPVYTADLHTPEYQRWAAGGPAVADGDDTEWCAFVKSAPARLVRYRILEQPPTKYQQWIREATSHIRAAGETHHEIPRVYADRIGLTASELDFWLIDSTTVLFYDYDPDGNETNMRVSTDTAHLAIVNGFVRLLAAAVTNGDTVAI